MSAVLVLTPVIAASWPVVAAAAAGALASLGFTTAKKAKQPAGAGCVTLEVAESSILAEEARDAGSLHFQKGDLAVEVLRTAAGGCQVKVSGQGRSEADLRTAGQEIIDRITQQYAYHRLVTELKQRNFEVVEEGVENDRSIKIRVRQWKT